MPRQRQGLGTPEPQHRTQTAAAPPPGPLRVPPSIHGGRTGRAPRAPGDLRWPPAPKPLDPPSPSPEPSPQAAAQLAAQLADPACLAPGANSNPRSSAEQPLPWGLQSQPGGLGTPEPQRRTQPAARKQPGPLGAPPEFRAVERAGAPEPPVNFDGPQCQNCWAHAPPPTRPHLGQPLRSPHSRHIGPARLLGTNPNPRSSTKGTRPGGLPPQRGGSGTPEPQRQTQPATAPQPGPLGAPPSIQRRRTGRDPEPLATFDHPSRQKPWAQVPPPPRCLISPTLRSPHTQRIGPAQLLRLTLTLGRPEGPLPRDLPPHRRGLGKPEPQQRDLPASAPPHEPLAVSTSIQGGRTGRAPRAPGDLPWPPCQNRWAHAPPPLRPHLGQPLHCL